MTLPPPVATKIDELSRDHAIASLWRERAAQHTDDSYAGIPMSKFPEDLRVYEHLLWEMKAEVVVEIGTQFGGSTLWFRDRLNTFARYRPGAVAPRVIAIDISISTTRETMTAADSSWPDQVELFEGDVREPELARRVIAAVPPGARVLVIEDSAHAYETTRAALELYSGLVQPGGFFVVEDGCVDIDALRLTDNWPRGVLPAIEQWLSTPAGVGFEVRRDFELYGLTCHPRGFLQRVSEP